jgi:CHAD domain-containing protein
MSQPAALSMLLHRALEPRVRRLLELCGAPGWQGDPECLHQVRIASRRVRAVLDLADPGRYPGFGRHERRLRRLTRALGLTRELDVHAAALAALQGDGSDPRRGIIIEFLSEGLDRRRRKSRKAMALRLEHVSVKDLDRLLAPPDILEPWLRAVEDALPGLLEHEEAAALHAFRIRVKRLRYTLEILEPAFPAPLADPLLELKNLQAALGLHHDHAVLEAYLWEVHGSLVGRGRAALAAGVLDVLGAVAEARRDAFHAFQSLGGRHREAVLFFRLKQALASAPESRP